MKDPQQQHEPEYFCTECGSGLFDSPNHAIDCYCEECKSEFRLDFKDKPVLIEKIEDEDFEIDFNPNSNDN